MYPAQLEIFPLSLDHPYLRQRRHLSWAALFGLEAVESLFAQYPALLTPIRGIPAHPETLLPLHRKDRSDTLRSSFIPTDSRNEENLRKQRLLRLT